MLVFLLDFFQIILVFSLYLAGPLQSHEFHSTLNWKRSLSIILVPQLCSPLVLMTQILSQELVNVLLVSIESQLFPV